MIADLRRALNLLDRRSRRILLLLVVVQVSLSGLDLVGVLLLGLVAAVSAASLTGEQTGMATSLLDRFGLSDWDPLRLAVVLAVVAAVALLTKSVVSFLLIRRTLRFLANRQAMVSSRLAAQLLSRPLLQVQALPSQQRAFSLTTAANAATIGVAGNGVVLIAELALLGVMGGALLFVDPAVALFTVIFFVVIGVAMNRVLGRFASRLGVQISTAEIESLTAVQDSLRTYREVSVSGRRGLFVEKFQALRWQAAKYQADNQIMTQISKYVFEVGLVIGGSVLAVWQFATQTPTAAVGILAVFLVAAGRIMPSLVRLQQGYLGIRSSLSVSRTILDLNDEMSADPEDNTAGNVASETLRQALNSTHEGFSASVQMRSVSLSYPGASRPAVEDLTLAVAAGDSLALVGPTGAGKSTVADVILGVIRPDSGDVTVGGLPVHDAISRWPGAIGYVPQETAVIQGSIRSNVALGLPEDWIDDDRVWEALERVQLIDLLTNQREGLDTQVGEHGVRLSGGQRQRLGIARALYTRPRLLVLDEATSALDSATENSVSAALGSLHGEVTMVIVAHRLATVRHCTQVAYLSEGRLESIGSFDEVRMAVPDFDQQARLLGIS